MKKQNSLTKALPKDWIRGVAALGVVAAVSLGAASAHAQTGRSQIVGISQEEARLVAVGWSAKKNIMGKPVYNDNNERIGTIDDLIISPKQAVSFAILGVGGFLGVGTHAVAVPMNQIRDDGNKLVLPGATREALKSMPEFQYAKMEKRDNRTSTR
jgi:sporulation protein YlmC with PRC-barrel domain